MVPLAGMHVSPQTEKLHRDETAAIIGTQQISLSELYSKYLIMKAESIISTTPALRSVCPLNPTSDNHQPDIADVNSLSYPLPFHCSALYSTGSISTCSSLPFSSHLFLMGFTFHSRIYMFCFFFFLNLWLCMCVFKCFKRNIWKHDTFKGLKGIH